MAKSQTEQVASLSQRLMEAGVPRQVDREFIASLGMVTWLGVEQSKARNPQTGEMGDGLLVTVQDDAGSQYISFIGNVALLRVLGTVDFPFRAGIRKSGRTWVFYEE